MLNIKKVIIWVLLVSCSFTFKRQDHCYCDVYNYIKTNNEITHQIRAAFKISKSQMSFGVDKHLIDFPEIDSIHLSELKAKNHLIEWDTNNERKKILVLFSPINKGYIYVNILRDTGDDDIGIIYRKNSKVISGLFKLNDDCLIESVSIIVNLKK